MTTIVHASTQDNVSGTPVACATFEESGTASVQIMVVGGNKSTYSAYTHSSVTSADTATTDLSTAGFGSANLLDLGNAQSLYIHADSSVNGATLNGRVIYYDGSSTPISISELINFTSDSTRRLSSTGNYICQHALVDVCAARYAKFYIENISSGTWNITIRPI